MRTEVIQEGDLMRFHFVQTSWWKEKSIPPPPINLTCCGSPEYLIKHHIRLLKTISGVYEEQKESLYHVIIAPSHLSLWHSKGVGICPV